MARIKPCDYCSDKKTCDVFNEKIRPIPRMVNGIQINCQRYRSKFKLGEMVSIPWGKPEDPIFYGIVIRLKDYYWKVLTPQAVRSYEEKQISGTGRIFNLCEYCDKGDFCSDDFDKCEIERPFVDHKIYHFDSFKRKIIDHSILVNQNHG